MARTLQPAPITQPPVHGKLALGPDPRDPLTTPQRRRLAIAQQRRDIDSLAAAPTPIRAEAFRIARAWMRAHGCEPGACLDAATAATMGLPHDALAADLWRRALHHAALAVALARME